MKRSLSLSLILGMFAGIAHAEQSALSTATEYTNLPRISKAYGPAFQVVNDKATPSYDSFIIEAARECHEWVRKAQDELTRQGAIIFSASCSENGEVQRYRYGNR